MCDATKSPVVFAHNDLLSGNILMVLQQPEQEKEQCGLEGSSCSAVSLPLIEGPMQLIDFEYSATGHRCSRLLNSQYPPFIISITGVSGCHHHNPWHFLHHHFSWHDWLYMQDLDLLVSVCHQLVRCMYRYPNH